MDEEQPLLSKGSAEEGMTTFPPPASWYSQLKQDVKDKKNRLPRTYTQAESHPYCQAFVTVFLPWIMFTGIVILFIFVYHESRMLVWAIMAACFFLGLLLIATGVGQSKSVHLAVGLLCLAAPGIGACIGIWIYENYALTYWHLRLGTTYRNVSPTSPGSDYNDAVILTFTQDAFVDTQRTVGYMEAGIVYCVAPVSTNLVSNTPQYWAAGRDCCDERSDFHCGDTHIKEAKSGMRILDGNDRDRYRTAVRMAESVYNLTANETGDYSLSWRLNNNLEEDLLTSCLIFLGLSSSLYFICSVCAAIVLRRSALFSNEGLSTYGAALLRDEEISTMSNSKHLASLD